MSTSPSPTPSPTSASAPTFYQRKTTQVQAVCWPCRDSAGDWPGETVAAIFNWVSEAGGTIVWRMGAITDHDATSEQPPTQMVATLVDDEGGEIQIADGEWIVRLPGFTDPATGKPGPDSRWIVESAATFTEDYTGQQRQRLAAQNDFLAQAQKLAKRAEVEEESMTPAQRREAANMDLHRLGDVAGKGGQQ